MTVPVLLSQNREFKCGCEEKTPGSNSHAGLCIFKGPASLTHMRIQGFHGAPQGLHERGSNEHVVCARRRWTGSFEAIHCHMWVSQMSPWNKDPSCMLLGSSVYVFKRNLITHAQLQIDRFRFPFLLMYADQSRSNRCCYPYC